VFEAMAQEHADDQQWAPARVTPDRREKTKATCWQTGKLLGV
jgi:hypothetical protein